MKKKIQITSQLITLGAVAVSSAAFAGVNNCRSYFPKVPYNCVVIKTQKIPSESADLSASKSGAEKAASSTGSHAQSKRRSVPRDVARKLRSQNGEL